jgi:hypothetical protein
MASFAIIIVLILRARVSPLLGLSCQITKHSSFRNMVFVELISGFLAHQSDTEALRGSCQDRLTLLPD